MDLKAALNDLTHSLDFFHSESLLSVALVLMLSADLIFGKRLRGWYYYLMLLTVGGNTVLLFSEYHLQSEGFFMGQLRLDSLAQFFKILLNFAAILALTLTHSERALFRTKPVKGAQVSKQDGKGRGEYSVILLGMLLGLQIMFMSVSLVMIFISVELVSIASYILVAFRLDKSASEAAAKYLIFGAASSAVMLYGITLLYGSLGTFELSGMVSSLGDGSSGSFQVIVGASMLLAGLMFKIGAVPFHFWVPDVYVGGPTAVVSWLSVAPKFGGMVVLCRLSFEGFYQSAYAEEFRMLLVIAAMGSIILGNFSALWQQGIKRLLAYSSIAHAGYMLIPLTAMSEAGEMSFKFYALAYLLKSFAAFGMVIIIENRFGNDHIKTLSGLGRHYVLFGILMLIGMISLTGLPPTLGFTAKFLIFTSLWDAYTLSGNEWLFWLLIIGLFNTAVSLLYYLKIPFYMFFRTRAHQVKLGVSIFQNIYLMVLSFLLIILFFVSGSLINQIHVFS